MPGGEGEAGRRGTHDGHRRRPDAQTGFEGELPGGCLLLNSKPGRARGFNPPAGDAVNLGDAPRQVTEVIWRIIGQPTEPVKDAGPLIEHRAVEDERPDEDAA